MNHRRSPDLASIEVVKKLLVGLLLGALLLVLLLRRVELSTLVAALVRVDGLLLAAA